MNIQRQEGKGETGGKTQKEWKEKERVPVKSEAELNTNTQTHPHRQGQCSNVLLLFGANSNVQHSFIHISQSLDK